jgi:general stress protein CsbA
MSELQLYRFNLLVVDDLVIPLFGVICVSAGIALVCVLTMVSNLYMNEYMDTFYI